MMDAEQKARTGWFDRPAIRPLAMHVAEREFCRSTEVGQYVAYWISATGQRLTATEGGHDTPQAAMAEARRYQREVQLLGVAAGTLELRQVED